MKKYIKAMMLACALSCSVGAVTVSADPAPSPVVPNVPTHTTTVTGESPKTGDQRTNPIYPIAASAVFAGMAVVAGKSLKKEQ